MFRCSDSQDYYSVHLRELVGGRDQRGLRAGLDQNISHCALPPSETPERKGSAYLNRTVPSVRDHDELGLRPRLVQLPSSGCGADAVVTSLDNNGWRGRRLKNSVPCGEPLQNRRRTGDVADLVDILLTEELAILNKSTVHKVVAL